MNELILFGGYIAGCWVALLVAGMICKNVCCALYLDTSEILAIVLWPLSLLVITISGIVALCSYLAEKGLETQSGKLFARFLWFITLPFCPFAIGHIIREKKKERDRNRRMLARFISQRKHELQSQE